MTERDTRPECGQQIFPEHPEWGDITCNREPGHEGTHARFDIPADLQEPR
jgi:hypothetical protein